MLVSRKLQLYLPAVHSNAEFVTQGLANYLVMVSMVMTDDVATKKLESTILPMEYYIIGMQLINLGLALSVQQVGMYQLMTNGLN